MRDTILISLDKGGRTMSKFFSAVFIFFFVLGCAGEVKQLHMKDTEGQTKTVEFPKGTFTGAASKEQASTLAQIFVDSHNMAMGELVQIKGNTEAIKQATQRIDESIKKLEDSSRMILETCKNNLETSQKTFQLLEQLSKRHGTGEITLFYPVGSSQIQMRSLEYQRLVNFSDFLSRESRGRKVLLISIGSASAFGDKKTNQVLAKKRSETPIDIIDQYLINIPHQFFKVYGIGDVYSPKNVTIKEHQRYQHVRIIAFYETDQVPPLLAEQ